jgi:hypothetical protein
MADGLRMFRSMTPDPADQDRPLVGPTRRRLGAKLPPDGDVTPNAQGNVGPTCHGMSVAPTLGTLPTHRCPARLRHLRAGATGNDNDRVFRFGEGTFAAQPVARGLRLCPDNVPAPEHGVVEPDALMPVADYQAHLAATRPSWVIDETGAP